MECLVALPNRSRGSRRPGSRLLTGASLIGLLILGGGAVAQENSTDPFFGVFSSEIPISIPPNHGLEPALKLTYSSSHTSSWAGVGWNLAGASFIERGSPGGGSPRYDDGDAFFLDGTELLPCTSQGGTHCPEIQNYTRIVRDATRDRWTVTGTNGNQAVYEPIFRTPEGTFRWMLSRLEDPRSNLVTFHYFCEEGERGIEGCYPEAVRYNGVEVTFSWEERPDVLTFATGAGIGRTDLRLALIDVTVRGERARAYRLAYEVSPATGGSLLTEVQQLGRDALVEGGEVAGGTALPPMTLTFTGDGDGRSFDFRQDLPGASEETSSFLGRSAAEVTAGDWNGDGRTDLLHLHPNADPRFSWVGLSNGDGTFEFRKALPGASTDTSSFLSSRFRTVHVGDWNGDGRSDLLHLHPHSDPKFSWVALSNGDGTFDFRKALPGASTETSSFLSQGAPDVHVGDWDGDGRADLLHLHPNRDPKFSWVALSNGDGTFDFQASLPGASTETSSFLGSSTREIAVGDWNGDGRSDLLHLHPRGDPRFSWVALSNGDGTFDFESSLPGASTETSSFLSTGFRTLQVGDWNGDGKSDLLHLHPNRDPKFSWVALAEGDGTFDFRKALPGASTETSSFLNRGHPGVLVADWNGDGRSDLAHLHPDADPKFSWVALANGDGRFEFESSFPGSSVDTSSFLSASFPTVQIGDWDGDGKADLLHLHPNRDPKFSWVALSEGAVPDLLAVLENGVGGSTAVEYAPSTRWRNTYLPEGLILQTVAALTTGDGRGHSSTVSYEYAGGLWSSEERRFLGFRRVTAVIDAQGNFTETFYYQRVGTVSKPEFTYVRDPRGRIFSYSAYRYTENEEPPYTSLMTERWDFECNLSNTCRRTFTGFAYDVFGNVVATFEHGDFDLSGDERTTIRGYFPNTQAYLVGFPAYENRYEGIGSEGRLLSQTLRLYDGNDTFEAPPKTGSATEVRKWVSVSGEYVSARFDYDAAGNRIRHVDERGGSTTTRYDRTLGLYPLRQCNAAGHCTEKEWDLTLGLQVAETDPTGATTTWRYDALGRAVAKTDPAGNTVRFEHLDVGDPTRQRIRESQPDGSADGLFVETYQDGLGRAYKTVREGGITRETVFGDSSDRVLEESLPYGPGEEPRWIVYTYDGAKRPRTTTYPDGATAETVYANDPAGKPFQASFDELGHEIVTWQDAYGNLLQIRERDANDLHHTLYEHDLLDKPVRIVDAAGNVSTFVWDSLGRKITSCDADLGCWSYDHDAGGLVVRRTDARGQTVEYAHDALGRRTSKTTPGGRTTWHYDEPGHGASRGRLTRVVTPHGRSEHTWDERGLEVSTTRCVQQTCETLARTHDPLGRLSVLTYPDGEEVRYAYDSLGRLAAVGGYVDSMEWDAAGQLVAMRYANGTSSRFRCDPSRRWLDAAEVVGPAGEPLYEARYTYDAGARVTGIASATHPLLNLSFAYDELDRLTRVGGAQTQSFGYDALGNMTHNSEIGDYRYDDPSHPHAVTAAGARRMTYDEVGNPVAVGERALQWDAESRLVEIREGGAATRFLYGAEGRRLAKIGPDASTRYFGELIERVDGERFQYVFAGPILVARRQTGGERLFYHADHIRSIRLTTDDAGRAVKSYEYAAFGEKLAETGEAVDERGFTGHRHDAESGLVWMGSRYYDPELGRFVSADTVVPEPGNPQALNRYSYAYNNPIANSDPTGHEPVSAVMGAMAAVGSFVATHWVATTAVIGAGLSVAGYATKNPYLSTVGGVLLGFAGGYASPVFGGWQEGLVGVGIAGVNSPLTPLDPDIKQAVGWAYTAYGLIGAYYAASPSLPAADAEVGQLMQEANASLQNLEVPASSVIEELASATNTDVAGWQEFFNDMVHKLMVERAAKRSSFFLQTDLMSNIQDVPYDSFWGSGLQQYYGQVAAERLGEFNRWQLSILNPTGGLTGPGAWGLPISRGPIAVHSAYHDADGFIYNAFGKGWGYAALPHPGLAAGLPVSGQVGGIAWQMLHPVRHHHGYVAPLYQERN